MKWREDVDPSIKRILIYEKVFLKYGFEFIVIFFGILISLYFEQSDKIELKMKEKIILLSS